MIVLKNFLFTIFAFGLFFASCTGQSNRSETVVSVKNTANQSIVTGAERTSVYLPFLQNKKVGLVVNQTSVVGQVHLLDTLLKLGVDVVKIYAPEHGFRGTADAGEKIKDGIDTKTGLKVVSLYGNNRKPKPEDIADVDVLVFDIQDVGARFYTYISTLHYVMEAAAENNKEVLVLDRPNPNGHYVAGNILDMKFKSFVGMHPIPVVHGMTVAEYAQMINGEKWLEGAVQSQLTVVPCLNYTHSTRYELPVKPSPNLPNARSIELYPSICFFEGTDVSLGRGTDFPFQAIGAPQMPSDLTDFEFTPRSMEGAKNPPHLDKTCYGFDLREHHLLFQSENLLNLDYLIVMYNLFPEKDKFFLKNGFFDKLAGSDQLRKDIVAGKSSEEIYNSWKKDEEKFKQTRKQYLLYPDFE
jgi:uncharacterized protein YbbC (DUF1343 family)